ncbi:MAG: WG repeat-containing protein [Cytophaga sp.]|uniref:WG repeat-containing protein n=1 Tax=Cytophaga sp. TaxID=29535 RepID=UPI003F81FB4B
MKNKIIFILLFVFYTLITYGQNALILIKVNNGFWGYADLNGDLTILPQYINCDPFSSNGLAVVKKGTVYKIINAQAEYIPTEVNRFSIIEGAFGVGAKGYKDNLLAVKTGEKWGFLNAKGKIAIAMKYDYVTEFNGGYAAAVIGGRNIILDTLGFEQTVISADYISKIEHFSEGFAPIKLGNGLHGFVNTKGEIVIKPQYKNTGEFSGGLAWVRNDKDKVGFINVKGEWVINPVYSVVTSFDYVSKFAKVKDNNGWHYIDSTGNKLFVSDTESWGDFSEGLAIGEQSGKYGFYNTRGEWVIKAQYEAARKFSNGYAAVRMNGTWGLIDVTGKWVFRPKYDGMYDVVLIK